MLIMCKIPSTFAGCCGTRSISLATGLAIYFGFIVGRGIIMTVSVADAVFNADDYPELAVYYNSIAMPQALMSIILGGNGIYALNRRDGYMLKTSYVALKFLLLCNILLDSAVLTFYCCSTRVYDNIFWSTVVCQCLINLIFYMYSYLMLGTIKSTIAVLNVGGTGHEHQGVNQLKAQPSETPDDLKHRSPAENV
ncbi:MAG: hypothetical protein KVP17_002832 [Porospora cf. gigantea B]|uniref:uncharacterized protein n=2 Tax=Porospora cf. gigantea B TaxID=2853592 RepID=UPI003571D048|nr:MAG: hypothetical protein KVP17_002832 [Porospora cf. gigantea B]